MPGYLLKDESVCVAGAAALDIRSLLDRQQYADPLGEAAALGISSGNWPLFGLVWPSSLQLAAVMVSRPVRARERILEIGCGLALASLISHRRGADVTASDCHPLAGAFLLENLRRNELLPLSYCHGDWGAAAELPGDAASPHGPRVRGLFELIIGSDVLYERDDAGILAGFIGRHAAPVGEVLIVDPDRGNRAAFTRRMAASGYELVETRLSRLADASLAAYKGRLLHYSRGALPS